MRVTADEKLVGAIDAFIDGVGRVTAWSSFALALVMGSNVLLRYGFSYGSVWAQELEWHLMAPICLFGMSYALRHGEHVRVDVLYDSFSQRTKDLMNLIAAVLAMTLSVLVIYLSWSYVGQSWSMSEGSANPGGIPARYILKALIPVGFALFFIQSLAEAIRSYRAWQKAS
jgi:TRAP-type mannitol/chloroaromatic compound transport system permease small subunit